MPRHSKHIAEYKATVLAIRDRASELGVDGDRIALWGVSLSGGHVLMAASEETNAIHGVRAVIANVPSLASGLEAFIGVMSSYPRLLLPSMPKMISGGIKGSLLGLLGKPWYLTMAGSPGSSAVMQTPGFANGYLSLCPPGGGKYKWKNGMTSASVLQFLLSRPLSHVASICLPVLLVAGGNDEVAPAKYAEEAARLIKGSELVILPGVGNLDIYDGEGLQRALNFELIFYRKICRMYNVRLLAERQAKA